jgi:hypothetical protein
LSPGLVEQVKIAKADLLALLSDGGPVPPVKATSEAHFVTKYRDDRPAATDPNRCNLCGKIETAGAAIVPFGGKTAGHVWLHPGCWEEWMIGRQAEARAAYAEWLKNAEPGEGSP